jgi:hypothetical protein
MWLQSGWRHNEEPACRQREVAGKENTDYEGKNSTFYIDMFDGVIDLC